MLPLAALLVLAAVVRVWGIDFGLPHLNTRPDEEAIASIASSLYAGDPNPHHFTYPPLMMIAVTVGMVMLDGFLWLAALVGAPLSFVSNDSAVKFAIARAISASAGVANVAVVYAATTRLAGRRAGLAAAAFLALAFLHVRDSHFGVSDVPMTFLGTAAFLWVVILWQTGQTRDLVGAATVAALATATKYNAAAVALPAAFVLLMDDRRPWMARVQRVVMFGLIMVGAFLVVAPYSLVETGQLIEDLQNVKAHLTGGHGPDLGYGLVYHVTTTLRYGLGLPLHLTAIGGLIWLLWRRPRVGITVALFPVAYYLVAGAGLTVFTRYMQPVIPFMCLIAGIAVARAAEWTMTAVRHPRWIPAATALLVTVIVWPSASAVVSFDRLIARDDTRLITRRWIEARFPAGTTIAQLGSGVIFTRDANEVPYAERPFTADGPQPEIVVLLSSALYEQPDLGAARALLDRDYVLDLRVDGIRANDRRNVYDRQDDFYLPMYGFHAIDRPGPTVKVYVRRDVRAARGL